MASRPHPPPPPRARSRAHTPARALAEVRSPSMGIPRGKTRLPPRLRSSHASGPGLRAPRGAAAAASHPGSAAAWLAPRPRPSLRAEGRGRCRGVVVGWGEGEEGAEVAGAGRGGEGRETGRRRGPGAARRAGRGRGSRAIGRGFRCCD